MTPNGMIAVEKNFISPEDCEHIKGMCLHDMKAATIGDDSLIEDVRRSSVHMIDSPIQHSDLFCHIYRKIWEVNQALFNFDIKNLNFLQFTEYNENNKGKYDVHQDLYDGLDHNGMPNSRKLSFTIQLTKPSEYSGGDLVFPEAPEQIPDFARNQGSIIIFSSAEPHGVTPVEKGVRHSLVGWCTGPYWR